MMLIVPVELEILAHDETTKNAELAGIETKFEDMLRHPMLFYDITSITSIKHDGEIYTEVYSGGRCFICPLSLNQVADIIHEAMTEELLIDINDEF